MEISEVLFNELAFFKLMQDLDSNSISVKQRCKRKIETAEEMQSYAKEVCLLSFLCFYKSLLCSHSIDCVET